MLGRNDRGLHFRNSCLTAGMRMMGDVEDKGDGISRKLLPIIYRKEDGLVKETVIDLGVG